MKRILYIEFLKITAANHLGMMLSALQSQKDCEIYLLCQKSSLLSRMAKSKTITTYEIEYTELNLHDVRTYLPFIQTILEIIKIINTHKINILHCHRLNWAYLAIIPSLLYKIPLFVHVVIIEELTSRVQKYIIRLHSNIHYVAVSKFAQKVFKEKHHLLETQITYHYGGLYFPVLDTYATKRIRWLEKITKEKVIVAMVSRIDILKGVDIFIETAAILLEKYPYLHFVHIGNHPDYNFSDGYLESCKRRISNLGIEKNITFHEYTDEILAYYKYFKVMVLPTTKDTLSYVNLEANYNGVPVVYTAVEGLLETLASKEKLSIPYPPSPVLFANKVSELLQDETEYLRLSNAVRENVLSKFDAEKNIIRLVSFYDKVL